MPKQDIRMNEEEIYRFLSSQTTAIVIAITGNAAPQGAVGRLHYDQGQVAFWLRDDDAVLPLLAADGRACCMVEQFPSYYEIAGVMLHGRASRRDVSEPGAAAFDLHVEKVVSFDFAKLVGSA